MSNLHDLRAVDKKGKEKNTCEVEIDTLCQTSDFTIHTFELRLRIASTQFYSLFEQFKALGIAGKRSGDYHCKPTDEIYHLKSGVFPGVRIRLQRLQTGMMPDGAFGYHNSLHLIVTPQVIIQNTLDESINYATLFKISEENCHKVIEYIERLAIKLSLHKLFDRYKKSYENIIPNGFESFKLERIDYAIDCKFQNPKMVGLYLKLCRKAYFPANMKPYVYYDEVSHRTKQPTSTLKYYSNTLSICIYDKEAQLHSIGETDTDILQSAEGVLRFEIQSYYNKVKHIKGKNGKDILPNFSMLLDAGTISYQEFSRIIPAIFFCGDYMTKSRFEKYLYILLKSKTVTEYSTEKLQTFIYMVEEMNSVTPVADALKSISYQRFANIRGKLDVLNINPVMAPTALKKTIGFGVLPSIPRLLGLQMPFRENSLKGINGAKEVSTVLYV